MARRQSIGSIPRVCVLCGNAFLTFPCRVRAGEAKYCGPACRAKGPHSLRPNAGKTTPDQKDEVVARYLAGEDTPTLARAYGIAPTAVQRLLKRRAVTLRPRPVTSRRYTLNERYFAKIDGEGPAYWLGFLAADGNVQHGAAVSVKLAGRDREQLVALQQALGNDGPISSEYHDDRHYVGARFWSPAMATDLARHGVVERKSPLVQWPSTVPSALLRHYLRGYHDGDGWMTVRTWQSSSLTWGLVANIAFLEACAAFLSAAVGVRPPRVRRRFPDKPYGSIEYGGRRQVSRIYHLLNDGATVWLPRKREKVLAYVYPAHSATCVCAPGPV